MALWVSRKNALFCFPCLIIGGEPKWSKEGFTNLRKLGERITKHEKSEKHAECIISFNLLGGQNICQYLSAAYKRSIAEHNARVEKNLKILSAIVDCVLVCGHQELPLRGHDESKGSDNPGVFIYFYYCMCEM